MLDAVYTPDNDFLSPQGLEFQVTDDEIEQSEGTIEPSEMLPVEQDVYSEEPKSDSFTKDDLIYDRSESSRQVDNTINYESSPVQMQFGEENGLQFPCIYIKSSQEGLEKHKLMALHNLVNAENAEMRLPTYLDVNGSCIKLGTIDSKSLKTLLSNKLFSNWGITVKADANTEYDGDMRLAYCSI